MKVIAVTRNGLNKISEVEVRSISVGGKILGTAQTSVDALIRDAKESGKMQIYVTNVNRLQGQIDADGGTPLYTNGQVSVIRLEVDDVVVWKK